MTERVLAAVQARMGSRRLPGKSLRRIDDRPMVFWIVDRLRRCRGVDEVVIATTCEESDAVLAAAADREGVAVYRGPVDDIAARLLGAIENYPAAWLLRVWGDCPFVDPGLADRMIARGVERDLDFMCTGLYGERTFPGGLDLELYKRATLVRLLQETDDPHLREYPIDFVMSHARLLRYEVMRNPQDLSWLYLTVDYQEDLDSVEKIIQALKKRGSDSGLSALLALFQECPALLASFAQKPRNVEYAAYVAGRKGDRVS